MTTVTSGMEKSLLSYYLKNYPAEAAELLNNCPIKEILEHLRNQSSDIAREVLKHLNANTAAETLDEMDSELFTNLFSTMDPYTAAILISRVEGREARKKLKLLPAKIAKEIKEVMTYPIDSAGFLMETRVILFNPTDTIADVLGRLRKLRDRRMIYTYVVDRDGKLVGRVPIHIIAISSPQDRLESLLEEVAGVHVMSPHEEVVELLQGGKVMSLPVVDLDNKLLGIIRYDALIKAAQQDAAEDVLAMFGAGREERALSKVTFAIRKRLPWLQINLATAFLAASVVGLFEETIARITVLAVFLPVVAGQSGNTGSQALAVTIRGLALREIRMGQWLKVARKEVAVGFINGIAVALTTSFVVYFWASSFGLAVVIATSMILSMVIAGFSGAVIPILLKSLGQDPAQSSSIVLTTVTDIVGFLSFLGLATALGSALGIT